MTLLGYDVKEEDFGMKSEFQFAFDKLSQLVGVKLPSKKSDNPSDTNVIESPFEGLELSESGNTFTIRAKAQNPAESVKEQAGEGGPKLDPDMEKLVRDAFSKMRGRGESHGIFAPLRLCVQIGGAAARGFGNVVDFR